jgi:signal transduction histidine kinase
LLQIEHQENRRLLAEWLAGDYHVVENAPIAEATFDLCLLDGPALARHQEAIAARKALDAPTFLPFLLAVRHTAEPLPAKIWASVDEVLFIPSEKAELKARLESLLRTRRLSLELSRRYEALKQYDRQKDEFLSVITHELRSPLTSILGYAEMLEDEIAGPLTDGQRDFVKQIEGGTDRVNRLVTDLLDFARVETGTFKLRLEEGDLKDQLEGALTALRPQAEAANVTLVSSVPEQPLPMSLDPQRIVQVFVNLIGNALKFTPKGGAIHVRACVLDGAVRCEVADNGPGIAPADMPKLFRRFSQLEAGQRKGGSGLGLSISKTIVEAHGGEIGVTDTPGGGATFWFSLPLAGVPAASHASGDGRAIRGAGG